MAAAVVLSITYGYMIERKGPDPLVDLIEHAMENLSRAFVPLSWAIDAVPAINYLPDWFPGMAYRKQLKNGKRSTKPRQSSHTLSSSGSWKNRLTGHDMFPTFSRRI